MNEFNKMMLLASLTAMYVVAAEDNISDLQHDIADEFCNLIKLDANEFQKLGLQILDS